MVWYASIRTHVKAIRSGAVRILNSFLAWNHIYDRNVFTACQINQVNSKEKKKELFLKLIGITLAHVRVFVRPLQNIALNELNV